jgi:hypothetical protein
LHAIKHILTGHKILPMTEKDLGDVLVIERVSFPQPWSWGQFKKDGVSLKKNLKIPFHSVTRQGLPSMGWKGRGWGAI